MFERWLEEYAVTIVTPSRLGITAQPEENARIKAAFYGRYAPCVIGHDSGLYLGKLPLDDVRQPGLICAAPTACG